LKQVAAREAKKRREEEAREKRERGKEEEKRKRSISAVNEIDSKERIACRKDLQAEIKRAKAESSLMVLQRFDEEQDARDVSAVFQPFHHGIHSTDIEAYASSCSVAMETLPYEDDASVCGGEKMHLWDNILQASSFFYVFRDLLQLEDAAHLESLLGALKNMCPRQNSPSDTSAECTIKVNTPNNHNGADTRVLAEKLDEEEEWDENEDFNSSNKLEDRSDKQMEQMRARRLIDVLELRLTGELKTAARALLLDGEDSDNMSHLPLNPLTWQEIVRIRLIGYVSTCVY
jgi:hypothetical protein